MNELKKQRETLGIGQIEAARLLRLPLKAYLACEEAEDSREEVTGLAQELLKRHLENSTLTRGQIEAACASVFPHYPEVEVAYLFGSYARKEATPSSDVDLVIAGVPSGFKFFACGADLEEEMGKEVDLLTYRQLMKNELLLKDVLVEGTVVYRAKNPSEE